MMKKNVIQVVLCSVAIALGLAVVCLFIPDGQILSQVRSEIEFSSGVAFSGIVPMNLYGYTLAGGLALSCLVLLLLSGDKQGAVKLFAAALWAGLLLSRLFFCLVNVKVFELSPLSCLYLTTGGLSIFGAMYGGVAGAVLCDRKGDCRYRPFAVCLAVFIPIARIAEYFSAESLGTGIDVEFGGLFSVSSMFGSVLNVHLIETLIGLCLLIAVIRFTKKPSRNVNDGLCFYLFLFGALQILMESLRRDGHMVWGFVKAQQVLSLLTATLCLMHFTAKSKRMIPAVALSAVVGICCFAMEKQLDRGYIAVPDWANYGVYAVIIAVYLLIGCRMIAKARKE